MFVCVENDVCEDGVCSELDPICLPMISNCVSVLL